MKYFQIFSRLRAHHPFLGDNDGHPVGIALFENDLAVLKVEDESQMKCRRKAVWPACLPSVVRNEMKIVYDANGKLLTVIE